MKGLRSCEETQTHAKIQLCMTGTYSTTLKAGWIKTMIITTLSEIKVQKLSLGQYLFKRYMFVPKG